VAAEEEGKASAMMFALLQEQHTTQLKAMVMANQKAMEAMFERINAIVGGQCKVVDKENMPPAAGNTGKSTGRTKRNRKSAPAAESTCFTSPPIATSLRPTKVSIGWGGSP
jgi:hypothetical protein